MVTTKFYLDCRRTRPGQTSVLKLAITQERKVAYISLDVRLQISQWDGVREKVSTKKTYMHTLNMITAFIGEDAIKKLRFEDITVDWLTSFNTFMSQTAPSPNGRNIHLRNLRAVFNNAIINDITTANGGRMV